MGKKNIFLSIPEKMEKELKKFSRKRGESLSVIFMRICETYFYMPEDFRQECLSFLDRRIRNKIILQKLQIKKGVDSMSVEFIEKDLDYYVFLYSLLKDIKNKGTEHEVENMRKRKLKDYIAYIPKEWVELNPDNSKEANNIIVICTDNAKDNIPFFAYYTDDTTYMIDDDYERKIFDMIIEKNATFTEVINAQVEPILNEDGEIMNEKEYENAPQIGFFDLYEYDSNIYSYHIHKTGIKVKKDDDEI